MDFSFLSWLNLFRAFLERCNFSDANFSGRCQLFRKMPTFYRQKSQPSNIFQFDLSTNKKPFATLFHHLTPCEARSLGRISRQVQHPCGGRASWPICPGLTFRHFFPAPFTGWEVPQLVVKRKGKFTTPQIALTQFRLIGIYGEKTAPRDRCFPRKTLGVGKTFDFSWQP